MSDAVQPVRIENVTISGHHVARVLGDIDLRTSPQLREDLLAAGRRRGPFVVDLSNVGYMDSSGVGTLVFVKREVERRGGKIFLMGLQPRVRSVFEITHLEKFFSIVTSVDEVGER